MKELIRTHIDPVTLSDNIHSHPQRNHWAIQTQRSGEDFPRIEQVFSDKASGRAEAYEVFAASDFRRNHILAGVTKLRIGDEFILRTSEGEIAQVHEETEEERRIRDDYKQEQAMRASDNSKLDTTDVHNREFHPPVYYHGHDVSHLGLPARYDSYSNTYVPILSPDLEAKIWSAIIRR